MRQVAEVELTHLPEEVESCCIIYLPHVGYLLAFPPTPALDLTLSSLDYHLPGLEFMFKTADMVLYKSQTCLGWSKVVLCVMSVHIYTSHVDICLSTYISRLSIHNASLHTSFKHSLFL